MGCINGEQINEVLASNGKPSILYKTFQGVLGNDELAMRAYLAALIEDEQSPLRARDNNNEPEFNYIPGLAQYQLTAEQELVEEVVHTVDYVDASRLDDMQKLIEKQVKALDARVRELEKSIKSLSKTDATIRQATINRIKVLKEQIKDAETREAFVALVNYSKKELAATAKWLDSSFNISNLVHRDTLLALSKQLDTYAGIVVPHFAAKHSQLQSDIIDINNLYDEIKTKVPQLTLEIWANIIAEKSNNKKFATKEDIVSFLKESGDIDLAQALVIDMSSSTDTLLALVDKIYKEKLEETHDIVTELREKSLEAGRKLVEAGYENQDFMIEKDASGNKTGNIISRLGAAWKEKKDSILAILDSNEVGADGRKVKRAYITKPKDQLTAEDKAHNKALSSDKKTVSTFLAAERWDKDSKKLIDGPNQKYTDEFKDARSKHEVYVDGRWIRSKMISDKVYEKFRRKYYKDDVEAYVLVKEAFEVTQPDGSVKTTYEATGEVELQTFRFAKDEYVEVREKWNSDEYNKIMSNDAQKEFYNFYTTTFKELMNKLPSDVAKKMDGRVFRIKDEFLTELSKKKGSIIKRVMKAIKEIFLPNIITNGRMLDEHGYPVDDVGIFYVGDLRSDARIASIEQEIADLVGKTDLTSKKQLAKLRNSLTIEQNKITPDQIQYDLVKSLVHGGAMVENYHTMKSVESTFLMAREILANKKFYKTDKFGDPVMDKDGNIEYINEESRALKRLDTYLRMIYYNNSTANNTTAGHIASVFKRYVSMGFQGLNFFSAVNNVVTAEVNQWIEAAGRRFYTTEQYSTANGIMNSHIAEFKWASNMFKQGGKYEEEVPYNKLTAMVEKFNFLEENSDREGGIKQKQTLGQYAKSFNWMFALIEGGEYQAQVKSAIAKMLNTPVTLEDGTVTNVWDAHEFEDGKLKLVSGVKFAQKDRIEVTGQIKNMNKYIHGNHSSVDKVAMQETWYGELALQFKRWMPNNFRSRFSNSYIDESLNMEMKGRYRAFLPFIQNLKDMGFNYKQAMEGLDELEQANMRKNIAEVIAFAIALALYIIFDAIRDKVPPEDEKLRAALNFLKKQSDRSMGEITAFVNPIQMYQSLKSPIAGFRMIAEAGEFLSAAVQVPWHLTLGDEKKLKFQKGVNKGKIKVFKEGRDLIPGWRTLSQWEQLDISGNFFIK